MQRKPCTGKLPTDGLQSSNECFEALDYCHSCKPDAHVAAPTPQVRTRHLLSFARSHSWSVVEWPKSSPLSISILYQTENWVLYGESWLVLMPAMHWRCWQETGHWGLLYIICPLEKQFKLLLTIWKQTRNIETWYGDNTLLRNFKGPSLLFISLACLILCEKCQCTKFNLLNSFLLRFRVIVLCYQTHSMGTVGKGDEFVTHEVLVYSVNGG